MWHAFSRRAVKQTSIPELFTATWLENGPSQDLRVKCSVSLSRSSIPLGISFVRWEFWLWHNMPLIHLLYSCQLHIYSCQQKASLNSYFHLFSHRNCPGKPKKDETCTSHPVQARGQALPDILWGKISTNIQNDDHCNVAKLHQLDIELLVVGHRHHDHHVIHILLRNSPTSMALQNSFKLGSIFFIASQEAQSRCCFSDPSVSRGVTWRVVVTGSYYTYQMVPYRILS